MSKLKEQAMKQAREMPLSELADQVAHGSATPGIHDVVLIDRCREVDSGVINPKPCDCGCDDIRIEHAVWNGRANNVAVIYCGECLEVEPVKVPNYITNTADFCQLMYKAWYQRNSSK